MLRVIRNHRRAAYNAPASEYEGCRCSPMGIDADLAPAGLLTAARGSVGSGARRRRTARLPQRPDDAAGPDRHHRPPDGLRHHRRRARLRAGQVQEAGRRRLLQDRQPVASNRRCEPRLQPEERKAILTYVLGTLSLDGAPHINRESLKAKGFTDDDLAKIETALPGVFELPFAFNAWTLGEEALDRLGISAEAAAKPGFDLLRALGFTGTQIDEANDAICGTMTVEGAPHLKDEHLPVFDCANKCGKNGHALHPPPGPHQDDGAAQPFLSGAISQDDQHAQRGDRRRHHRRLPGAWKGGIKAMALYRDGSKLSQPLSTKSDVSVKEGDGGRGRARRGRPAADRRRGRRGRRRREGRMGRAACQGRCRARGAGAPVASARSGRISSSSRSSLLQDRRRTGDACQPSATASPRKRGWRGTRSSCARASTRTARLGEIFIDMHKEGAAFRSMINCFAIAISKGLQYGVPLDEFVETFTFTRFEPQGMVTGHPTSSWRPASSTTSSACSAWSTWAAPTSSRSRPSKLSRRTPTRARESTTTTKESPSRSFPPGTPGRQSPPRSTSTAGRDRDCSGRRHHPDPDRLRQRPRKWQRQRPRT